MKIEQIYTGCLAEAAYYIESDGEVAIIDPLRETEPYIERATKSKAKIKYIFETHFHADFVSGHVDLAAKTGAKIIYGPNATASFNFHPGKDGEVFTLGKITITLLHTPGHTLESSTYLLKDEKGKPHCIFTGDTLFIGDVGRPDLAVKSNLTKEDLAGMLFDSLHTKIMNLPDEVIVYPAHGAGSACGKNMSQDTFSTLGEQKKSNYALKTQSKEEFVNELTSGIMPPPQYFAKNAMINKTGYDSYEEVLKRGTQPLSLDEFNQLVKEGALIIDTRNKDIFVKGFVPNSMFIGLDGQFAVWAGALITDMKQKIVLVAEEGKESEAVMRLARVGYDFCLGFLKGGLKTWTDAGNPIDHIDTVSAEDMADLHPKGNVKIMDVRKPSEYENNHIDGAVLFPLDFLNDHLHDLDKNQHYYIQCRSGYRSLIAISLLKQQGYSKLTDVLGGILALEKTSIPLTALACHSKN